MNFGDSPRIDIYKTPLYTRYIDTEYITTGVNEIMIDVLLKHQVEIFIVIEVLSLVSLLLFGIVRYLVNKYRLSLAFIFLFILFIACEAIMAWIIYQETGEISNLLIIITVFVLYACTFGISDFKKLDRWMRKHIGKWRGVELLTEKDMQIMARQKDPKHIARKYRWSSTIHLGIFVTVQIGFWIYGTNSIQEMFYYVKDLSWIGTENIAETPYANETIYGISMVWGLVFVVDFIWSWSYTVFPSQSKG